jgi:NAD(P)-dependent dehydrogenase (short-subunit alcohol dehydrogenase family)
VTELALPGLDEPGGSGYPRKPFLPAEYAADGGYRPNGRLGGLVALVTTADSEISRAIAVCFAREGARIALCYFESLQDAYETRRLVRACGTDCVLLAGDPADRDTCLRIVENVVSELGGLDILVNNAGEAAMLPKSMGESGPGGFLPRHAFAYLYLMTAALPYFPMDGSIINVGYAADAEDDWKTPQQAAAQGSVQGLTRAFSRAAALRGIRVNAAMFGDLSTAAANATPTPQQADRFGKDSLPGRSGRPYEAAPAFVFLGSRDASYLTGQIIYINAGGHISA